MKLTLQIIFSLLFITTCYADNVKYDETKELESNVTVNQFFNKKEISDLGTLLNFFENQICLKQKGDKINRRTCYEKFLKKMFENSEKGQLTLNIPFTEQEKTYNKISNSTFHQIWSFGKTWTRGTTDTLEYLQFNLNGKYLKFLQALGKNNLIAKDYYTTTEMFGTITPSIVAEMIKEYKKLDISDVRERLMIPLHYLTLNDEQKRHEK